MKKSSLVTIAPSSHLQLLGRVASLLTSVALVTGCGSLDLLSSSGSGASTAPAPTTVSGTLGGTINSMAVHANAVACTMPENNRTALPLGLAGTTVECTTLTNPSYSGSGVTDSGGNFAVTFSGSGVPFSCFLSSGAGPQVPLAFSSADGSSSSSIVQTSTGSVSLGTVVVATDSTTGAQTVTATLTSSTPVAIQTATPPGLPCMVGLWKGSTVNNCFPGHSTTPLTQLNLSVAQLPSGDYVGGLTYSGALVTEALLSSATMPATSTCLPASGGFSQTGLTVGMSLYDPGNYVPADATIVALPGSSDPNCPLGIVMSKATTNTSPQSDGSLTWLDCSGKAPAVNISSIAYDSSSSTMTIVHPANCVQTGVAAFQTSPLVQCASGSNTLSGALTTGSKCVNLTSGAGTLPAGLASGDSVTTQPNSVQQTIYLSSDTANFCGAGQIQMSAPATGTGSGVIVLGSNIGQAYLRGSYTAGSRCVTPIGLPTGSPGALGSSGNVSDSSTLTNNFTFTAVNSTTCPVAGSLQMSGNVANVAGSGSITVLVTDATNGGATPFWATITNGSPCLVPAYGGDEQRIITGITTYSTAATDGYIAAGTNVVNASACSSTQGQLAKTATVAENTTVVDNTNSAGSFTGTTTLGSTCVTPDAYAVGEIIADQSAAIPNGTTVVPSDGTTCTSSQLQMSAAATATVTSDTIAVLPLSALGSTGCYFYGSGPALDKNGNYFWNGAGDSCNNLSATSQQTAWTETEVIPINSSCTAMWDAASIACITTPNSANCANSTPPSFSGYEKTVSGCAACFPGASFGAGDAGCAGVGKVTCTSAAGTIGNQVLVKQ